MRPILHPILRQTEGPPRPNRRAYSQGAKRQVGRLATDGSPQRRLQGGKWIDRRSCAGSIDVTAFPVSILREEVPAAQARRWLRQQRGRLPRAAQQSAGVLRRRSGLRRFAAAAAAGHRFVRRLAGRRDALVADAKICDGKPGRSKATVNKLFRVVTAVWRFAHDQELVAKLPKVEKYREDDLEPECWSPEEFDQILHHAARVKGRVGDVSAGIFWLALITFKYSVGARISAVMRTPSKSLDLPAAQVKIPASVQKQKDDQRFDLLPQAVEALSMLRPERHVCIFDDWRHDRTQMGWRALTKGLRKILRAAKLPDTSRDLWHKIRRTTITFVAAAAGRPRPSRSLATLIHRSPSDTWTSGFSIVSACATSCRSRRSKFNCGCSAETTARLKTPLLGSPHRIQKPVCARVCGFDAHLWYLPIHDGSPRHLWAGGRSLRAVGVAWRERTARGGSNSRQEKLPPPPIFR
jgi:hypothetical protein